VKVTETSLPGVLVIEPSVFKDDRGFFLETWAASKYAEVGIPGPFVQDNLSRSIRNTLRGLHFQEPTGQGKLCSVARGTVYDVAVDVRRGSSHFGKWVAVELSDVTMRQIWIPPGFAHGFCVVSEVAEFLYKCTQPYNRAAEQTIVWNDPALAIPWPLTGEPLLSPKDRGAPTLRDAPVLPTTGNA
jgi:dTDP-4-dehydrorhamnose 3,5-epimerase